MNLPTRRQVLEHREAIELSLLFRGRPAVYRITWEKRLVNPDLVRKFLA